MQFLYPKSRQFPFDDIGEQIVRALHARNFTVPGFTIEFRDYGSGEQKLRHISVIENDELDVRIWFGRRQGTLPGGKYNDCAAVAEVRLGGRILHVFDDESGPTYDVYVGDNWARDRKTWWNRPNQRLNNEPRLCVRYRGRARWQGERPARLEPEGQHDHREHAPGASEPAYYVLTDLFAGVVAELGVVLAAIERHPPATVIVDVCAPPAPIPMPAGLDLFTYCDHASERRVTQAKQDPSKLEPFDRYGLSAGGMRLAPTYIKSGPDLPAIAYEGFRWCSTSTRIPGQFRFSSETVLFAVNPKDARGIYVADHAAYERARTRNIEEAPWSKRGRDSFTNEEVNSFTRARACTIVPLTEYRGDFEDPVYLISRELAIDEVTLIGDVGEQRT